MSTFDAPAPTDLGRPPAFADRSSTDTAELDRWIAGRARALLSDVDLVCDGQRHRILEVELYLGCARHRDPFVHGAAEQEQPGAWYFHRSGGSYRGGTFKGLDFSSGAPGVQCGWLLRSVECDDGRLIDGSCNVVDHLLGVAGERHIEPLHHASPRRPRSVEPPAPGAVAPRTDRIWSTPRVGLTLKRAAEHPAMPAWIGRRLRFVTAPRRIRKGRVQTIAALLADGLDVEAIHRVTGSPRRGLAPGGRCFCRRAEP